jgi:hypothetical protein
MQSYTYAILKNVKFDKDDLTFYCHIIAKLIYLTNIWPILHM